MYYYSGVLPVAPQSRFFRALGDPTRVRMVALLSHGELCVCHFEETLGLSQPSASNHLAVLRNAGVVESYRKKSWVYYRLANQADSVCDRLLKSLAKAFQSDSHLHSDVESVQSDYGPGAKPKKAEK